MRRSYFIPFLCLIFTIQLFGQEKNPVLEKEYFKHEYARYQKLFESQSRNESMAGDNFDAKYYKIDITITTSPEYIRGIVTMNAVSSVSNLTVITLDLMNSLTVDSVKVGGFPVSFTQYPSSVNITLNRTYTNGELFQVILYYQGVPGSSGFGSFEFYSHSGTPWVWSLSEPYGAKDWWPCKDHPSDKADSVDILVTCNSAFKVGSNGKLISVTNNGNGTSTHFWKTVYPISTYLVSVALTNYAEFSNWFKYTPTDSMEVLNYVLPEHLSSAQSGLPRAVDGLEIFSDLYGLYPFINEKYGHSEFGWGGGMEHQTMTSLGGFSEGLVIHELSHQWFGDMITCRTWPDLWLNEGFATYSEALYNERKYGTSSYWSTINYEINSAKSATGTLYLQDTSSVGSMFSYSRVYAKGATVLHMLRHVLGDSLFFAAIYNYANDPRFKYGTAITTDFQEVCENTSGMDLDYFFNEWVFGESYPRYEYNWIAEQIGDEYLVTVIINQSTPSSNPPFFTMPVDLRVVGTGWDTTVVVFNDAIQDTFTFTVSRNPAGVELDPQGWILKSIASGSITILPLTKYFGDVVLGTSKIDSVTVMNYGTAAVTVSSSSTLSDFSVSPSSALIPMSGSKRFYVTFTPATYGNRSGAIVFTYSGPGSPDSVIVSGNGVDPTISYQMLDKWNMISVPLKVNDLRKSILFPTAVSDAFEYDITSETYIPEDTLKYGHGYWLKFSSAQKINIQGSYRNSDTIDISPAWNLIGSISDPIPSLAVQKEPAEMVISEFFGYEGTYFISDTLFPSRGYWVKSGSTGQLILNSSYELGGRQSIKNRLSDFHKINFINGSGHSQTLYMNDSDIEMDPINFELPPVPPDGIYDVRFGTNTLLVNCFNTNLKEVPIEIKSGSLPLRIAWDIGESEKIYKLIIDDQEMNMTNKGEITYLKEPQKIVLKILDKTNSSIPEKFSLRQNYPNPFNPSTQIFYDLPIDCQVNLKIYDVLGREVGTIINEYQKAGFKSVSFDASNLPSGFYFYKINAGSWSDVKKMLLLR